jgi:cleavage and polyadenylation specificity factor subunit 2
MLTFVRSMMEWLGGTINKEDVGVDGDNKIRRRRDDNDEEALGAFSLRFKCVFLSVVYLDRALMVCLIDI